MEIMLGNTTFDLVEERMGFKLTDEDKVLWDEFYSNKADLSEKESCFHAFDIPTCIVFKGEPAKQAVLKMFTPDKIVKRVGEFMVYEQS